MAYSKQTWANDIAGGTPLSAARLNVMEAGIELADLHARTGSGSPEGVVTAPIGDFYTDTATGTLYLKASGTGNTGWVEKGAAGPAGSSGTGDSGIIEVDDYDGTDDQKLALAMTAAQADTYTRTMRLSARLWTFTSSKNLFDGFKLIGSGGGAAVDQPKSANPYATKVQVNVNGTFLVADAYYEDIYIAHIAFNGKSDGTTTWMHYTGTGYVNLCTFHQLGFFGFKNVFGTDTTPFPMGGTVIGGWWNINGAKGIQVHIGGSDNTLWTDGLFLDSPYRSYPSDGYTAGPLMRFKNLGMTEVGPIYVTADAEPGQIQIDFGTADTGTSAHHWHLLLRGWRVGGRQENYPHTVTPLVTVTGKGSATFDHCWMGYTNPGTGNAIVEVSGGANVFFDAPEYRPMATANTWTDITQPYPTCWISAEGAGTQVRIRNAQASLNLMTQPETGRAMGLPRVAAFDGADLNIDDSVDLWTIRNDWETTAADAATVTAGTAGNANAPDAPVAVTTTGGTVKFSTTNPASGTRCLAINQTSAAATNVYWSDWAPQSKASFRFDFRTDDATPANLHVIAYITSSTGSSKYLRISLGADGKLYVTDLAGASVASTNALTVNTWYTIVGHVDASAGTSAGAATINVGTLGAAADANLSFALTGKNYGDGSSGIMSRFYLGTDTTGPASATDKYDNVIYRGGVAELLAAGS